MWFIVARLRRRPASGNRQSYGRFLAALGQRRVLGMMNHITPSNASCREPPETVLMGRDHCRLVLGAKLCLELVDALRFSLHQRFHFHSRGPHCLQIGIRAIHRAVAGFRFKPVKIGQRQGDK